MKRSLEQYAKKILDGWQHYHVLVHGNSSQEKIYDLIFEDCFDASDAFFDIIDILHPEYINEEEREAAIDTFDYLCAESTEDESDAFLGLKTMDIFFLLKDCYGCIPSCSN
jgi:hypothetical protein